MITKLNIFKESILVPRNIEGRQNKLRQETIKFLQQEIINGDLVITEEMLDIPSELVKIKQVNGNLYCIILHLTKLPEWFKNIEIKNCFDCSHNYLQTLENCPQKIGGYVNCSDNKLTTLKGIPEIINGTFICSNNKLTSLEDGPKIVKGDYYCYNNMISFLKPDNLIMKYGEFIGA